MYLLSRNLVLLWCQDSVGRQLDRRANRLHCQLIPANPCCELGHPENSFWLPVPGKRRSEKAREEPFMQIVFTDSPSYSITYRLSKTWDLKPGHFYTAQASLLCWPVHKQSALILGTSVYSKFTTLWLHVHQLNISHAGQL